MSAAWLLSRQHDVTLLEKEPRVGGHSNTVDVDEAHGPVPIDTGFIVYNTACYPNLIALFDYLDVPTAPTDMSFSVSLDGGRYEYNGNGLDGFFAQRRNLLSPTHWRMAGEIGRFFREAAELHGQAADLTLTLDDWLGERRYSRSFIERHIVPMGAAIWSVPAAEMLKFPAQSFARFFANHGLLQMQNRPQWRTVKGGIREYVSRLMAEFEGESINGDGVVSITRSHGDGPVQVQTRSGAQRSFDRCLIACHADDALGLLKDASAHERRLLGAFQYADNDTVLHTDPTLMPRRRRVWTSWNYLGASAEMASSSASVTYWMNKLQPLATSKDYFVSLNPRRPISADQVLARFSYQHPLFDAGALQAQTQLWSLQGERNTWFAGSYFGYGFHEDALQAGLAAAEALSCASEVPAVRRPWKVAGESNRLVLSPHAPVNPLSRPLEVAEP